jgi:hypothetical protein
MTHLLLRRRDRPPGINPKAEGRRERGNQTHPPVAGSDSSLLCQVSTAKGKTVAEKKWM